MTLDMAGVTRYTAHVTQYTKEYTMSGKKERNISVDGKNYTFLIGKRFVQIRHIDDDAKSFVEKKDIGVVVAENIIVVKPSMIADYIKHGHALEKPEKYFRHCSHENRKIAVDPFDYEIHDKIVYVYCCKDCLDESADNI
jgi:hypothetical protein